MKLNAAVGTLFFVIMSGCAGSSTMYWLNEGVTPVRGIPADKIAIHALSDIGENYTELGTVSVSFSNQLDGKIYVNAMKEEAAKMGADAIIQYRQVGTRAVGIGVKYVE